MGRIKLFYTVLVVILVSIAATMVRAEGVQPTPPASPFFTTPGLSIRTDRSDSVLANPNASIGANSMSFLPAIGGGTACDPAKGCNPAIGTVIDPFYRPNPTPTSSTLLNPPGDYPELCRAVDNNGTGASANSIMAPYNTVGEWVAFLLNMPAGLQAHPCCRQIKLANIMEILNNHNPNDPAQNAIYNNFQGDLSTIGALYSAVASSTQEVPYARVGDSFIYLIQVTNAATNQVDAYTVTATCQPNTYVRDQYLASLSDPSGKTNQLFSNGSSPACDTSVTPAQAAIGVTVQSKEIACALGNALLTSAGGQPTGNTYAVAPGNIFIGSEPNGVAMVGVAAGASGPGSLIAVGRDGSVVRMGPFGTAVEYGVDPISGATGLNLANATAAQAYYQLNPPNTGTGTGVGTGATSSTVSSVLPFFNSAGALTPIGSTFVSNAGNLGSSFFGLVGTGVAPGGNATVVQYTPPSGSPISVPTTTSATFAGLLGSGLPAITVSSSSSSGGGLSPVIGVDTGPSSVGGSPTTDAAVTGVVVGNTGNMSFILGGTGSSTNTNIDPASSSSTVIPVAGGQVTTGTGTNTGTGTSTQTATSVGTGTNTNVNPSLLSNGMGTTYGITQITNLGCVANCAPPPPIACDNCGTSSGGEGGGGDGGGDGGAD